jgi:hypothetical protein
MGYALPQHLSFCASGDEVVFLDLRRDRYFRLAPPLLNDFNALRNGGPFDQPRALVAAGIVVETPELNTAIRPTEGVAPRRSILEDSAAPHAQSLDATAAVAMALWATRRELKIRPFARVIADLRARKARQALRPRSRRNPDVETASRTFLMARSALPIPSICLLDSLALCRRLTAQGLESDLILGVCPSPFRAHAWVQHDEVVLNDTLDVARMHSPILVI